MRFISLVLTFIVVTLPRWWDFLTDDADYIVVKKEWK
jgi:hypothetical protein